MHASTLLFPTDFSQSSQEGLVYATSLARAMQASLLILHVEDAGETYEGEYYGPSEELRANLRQQLEAMAPGDSTVPFRRRYEMGPSAKTICDVAREEHVDLIVMPTHGRRGLRHLVMGSVAESVVQRAPCPVVTVRPAVIKQNPLPRVGPRLRPLSREEVREIDRCAIEEVGVPGAALMENAGRGTADLLEQLGIEGPVVIVVGRGNNGGDGSVIARHLDCRGYEVRVLLLGSTDGLRGDALNQWKIINATDLTTKELGDAPNIEDIEWAVKGADWTVDALLGTGTQGEIQEPYASVIECLNRSARKILAVDLPSGLDCNTGLPLGPCIRARDTATFIARKIGFDARDSAQYTGQVHTIEIGVPRVVLEPFEVREDAR